MTNTINGKGNLLSDAEQMTPFGHFLGSTSPDELPELFNVVKGDMSRIGPRPLLMRYLDRYTPEQARRHEVEPGITRWAQVNGRNAISRKDKSLAGGRGRKSDNRTTDDWMASPSFLVSKRAFYIR